MRLFVGVTLEEELRVQAAIVARELQRQLDPRIRVAWIPFEKMHFTVRFIGHVDDARATAILEALRPPLPIAPFDIVLGNCGAFPRNGSPRVVWVGLTEGVAGLRAMHEEFNRRLNPLGLTPEDREFNAHLTLGRVKDVPRDAVRAAREMLAALHVGPARGRIDHATLFESRLSPRGSTYLRLLDVPLL